MPPKQVLDSLKRVGKQDLLGVLIELGGEARVSIPTHRQGLAWLQLLADAKRVSMPGFLNTLSRCRAEWERG